MIIPLLAFPLLRGDLSRAVRRGWFALLVVWWMLLLVSATRGSWAALAVAATVLFMWARHAAWPWLRIQSMGLGLGALLFVVLFFGVPTLLGIEAGVENRLDNLSTLSGREVIWGLALQQITQHPWLGIGPMHLASIHNEVAAHPHNSVLQLAAEWGIPAALAWLMAAAIGLIAFLRPLRHVEEDGVLRVCLAAALLAAAAQSLVDGVIVIPYTQLWLVLVVGWALGVHGRNPCVVQSIIPSTQTWMVRVAALAAGGLLVWGIYPEIFNRADAAEVYLKHHPNLLPRYWGLGWIP
jgi:O-antigen ligase